MLINVFIGVFMFEHFNKVAAHDTSGLEADHLPGACFMPVA